jgi:hypothetical protein
MEIPHLETRWDFRLRRESCLVNLYPHPRAISKVGRNNAEIINARADYFPRRPHKLRELTRAIRFAARAFIFFMSDGASNSTSSLLLVIYLFVFLEHADLFVFGWLGESGAVKCFLAINFMAPIQIYLVS